MKVSQTNLAGVVVIEPDVYGDNRGYFLELYNAARYAAEAGIEAPFVQDNHSRSSRNVLRGLHLQLTFPQGKLVSVSRGEIWCVVADVEPASATYRQHVGVPLSSRNHQQLYVPPGYAHGFCVVSESADVSYKCTEYYHPEDEAGIIWNDPTLAIAWPTASPVLSERDTNNLTLEEFVRTRRGG